MSIKINLDQFKDEIISSYLGGSGTSLLGKKYNCNSGTIWFFLKKNGIEVKKRSDKYGKTDEYLPKIREYIGQGLSAYKAAKLIGIGKELVLRLMKKDGLSTSQKSTARIDPLKNHTKEIIDLYLSGLSMQEVADIYKCDNVSVMQLLENNNIERRPIAIYTYDENLFEKINSEETAYILGFWFADGNVRQNNAGIRIEICDREILEKFKSIFKFTGPIYDKGRKTERHQFQYGLGINSKKLALQFEKLGCMANKTFQLKFPAEETISNDLIRHFCRGYWDGDGGHGKYGKKFPRWCGSVLGTRNMMDGFEKASGIKGYFDQRHPERGKDNWTLVFSNRYALFNILNWLYKDATIYLERKYQKYKEFLVDYELMEGRLKSKMKTN